MASLKTRPTFDQLPLQPDHPRRSAWGLWGADDQLGTLNLLDEESVRAATAEVKHGTVVTLKSVLCPLALRNHRQLLND